MNRVSDVMQSVLVTASPDESVNGASKRMESLEMGCLPVVGTDGKVLGLLTIWDARRAHPNRLVIDAMTTHVTTISLDASTWEAHRWAEENSVEHLLVMDGERLIGVASRGDLAVAVARLTDALTGLPSAAYLRHKVGALWRSGLDVCLIFIDVNEFGPLNKRAGHAAGDRALQLIARVLASHLDHEKDLLCRYGGDEFAILTSRSESETQLLAETLVREVADATAASGLALAISVGIAGGRRRSLRQPDADTVDHLINLASVASTKAKRISSGVLLIKGVAGA